MAQKLILCEGMVNSDLLQTEPLATHIADGYEVSSVSGFATQDNRALAFVLLAEPATETETDDETPAEETPAETPSGRNNN